MHSPLEPKQGGAKADRERDRSGRKTPSRFRQATCDFAFWRPELRGLPASGFRPAATYSPAIVGQKSPASRNSPSRSKAG